MCWSPWISKIKLQLIYGIKVTKKCFVICDFLLYKLTYEIHHHLLKPLSFLRAMFPLCPELLGTDSKWIYQERTQTSKTRHYSFTNTEYPRKLNGGKTGWNNILKFYGINFFCSGKGVIRLQEMSSPILSGASGAGVA